MLQPPCIIAPKVLLPKGQKHTEAAIIAEAERLFESTRLMAIRVRKNIQQKDMELGRDLGNWILRRLDQTKHTEPSIGTRPRESIRLKSQASTQAPQNGEVGRHLFMSLRDLERKLS
ncbi:unnamed protein product [Microthlaspi erraticum]|uniref:Uncharacterized protein n=1 Tax=Microthlaspi erraticum TaxID=1685480 RepID=A0A6D2IC17_9BRAS|nr:unnamed protein product [Microthlaspi erraticum]